MKQWELKTQSFRRFGHLINIDGWLSGNFTVPLSCFPTRILLILRSGDFCFQNVIGNLRPYCIINYSIILLSFTAQRIYLQLVSPFKISSHVGAGWKYGTLYNTRTRDCPQNVKLCQARWATCRLNEYIYSMYIMSLSDVAWTLTFCSLQANFGG